MNEQERRAKVLGLKTYDWALPLDWVRQLQPNSAGEHYPPNGHIVWCYDKREGLSDLLGYPVALDLTGRKIIVTAATHGVWPTGYVPDKVMYEAYLPDDEAHIHQLEERLTSLRRQVLIAKQFLRQVNGEETSD